MRPAAEAQRPRAGPPGGSGTSEWQRGTSPSLAEEQSLAGRRETSGPAYRGRPTGAVLPGPPPSASGRTSSAPRRAFSASVSTCVLVLLLGPVRRVALDRHLESFDQVRAVEAIELSEQLILFVLIQAVERPRGLFLLPA